MTKEENKKRLKTILIEMLNLAKKGNLTEVRKINDDTFTLDNSRLINI